MSIRKIRIVPDPVLRTPCDEIREITPAVKHLVDDLLETVNDPGRAGLSANQIGVSFRAFSYNINGRIGYILNPVIEELKGEQYDDEGCLSVPGLWYKTRRANYARARGIDLDGKTVVLEGEGLMARMIQHECDHLDGHIYLDRLEKDVRRQALRE
ncbi:peptide deformylase, partial [Bifidobacteriaceae bacterium WP022]